MHEGFQTKRWCSCSYPVWRHQVERFNSLSFPTEDTMSSIDITIHSTHDILLHRLFNNAVWHKLSKTTVVYLLMTQTWRF